MSSFKSLLSSDNPLDASAVTGNGTFDLFVSEKQNAPNDYQASDKSLEVIITYADNQPDPEVTVAKYNLSAIVETEDDAGNWHPILNQFRAYVKAENGPQHILRLDPSVIVLDAGVPNDIYNGVSTIAVESIKQGTLPDDFRLKIQCNEYGYDANGPTPASFQSVIVSAAYRTY